MKKVVDFFKSPLFIPVVILMIPYGYWLMFIPSKTFFSNVDLRLGIICLIIYLIITMLGKVLINNLRLPFLPYIVVIPISFAGMYFAILYFPLMFYFGFYEFRPVFASIAGIILVVVITYKKLSNQGIRQIAFFLATLPVFILAFINFIIFCPTVWAADEFGSYKYYVIEEIYDYPHSDTDFYKCKKLSFQCDILSGTRYGLPEIIVDKQKKEVSLIDSWGLRYTDGVSPRRYTGEGGQLGSHKYYLSEKCNNFNYDGQYNCETYTFIPYECDLDNKSCNLLPIKVEGEGDYTYYYWEADEAKKAISLLYSDDKVLIFTYGKHPVCYVKECEILQSK